MPQFSNKISPLYRPKREYRGLFGENAGILLL